MHPANERRYYIVTSSPIGWVYTKWSLCLTLRNKLQWNLNQFSAKKFNLKMSSAKWQGSFCVCNPANERRYYIVTSSPIGWVYTKWSLCLTLRNKTSVKFEPIFCQEIEFENVFFKMTPIFSALSIVKTGIYQNTLVTIAADALAPYISRP